MSYQLELRHYRYFQALAEELNYHKAAEKLYISQPGLSRQIKQMEDILKVPLFERTKRKVALTKAGEYLKTEVDYIITHLESVTNQLHLIEAGKSGELRIGFLGSAMHAVVPNLMIKLNHHYPDLHANLEELSNQTQIEALLNNELDIGFVRLGRVPDDLKMFPISRDYFSLVLPTNHAITAENFKHVGQLQHEDFIMFSSDYSPHYYDNIMSICEDQGFTPSISHKSVNAHTIFKLVESGLGVAIVPSSLEHGYDLDVKFIPLTDITQTTVLSVVWHTANRNPATKHVLELLLDPDEL